MMLHYLKSHSIPKTKEKETGNEIHYMGPIRPVKDTI